MDLLWQPLADLDPDMLLAAALAAVSVGLAKGGMQVAGMLAVPMLSLTMSPVAAAAALLPIFVLTDMVGVWVFRRHFDVWNLRILLPSALFGVGLGWALASVISDAAVGLIVGGLGLVYCGGRLVQTLSRRIAIKPSPTPSVLAGWFWGTLSGFTSFVSHAGAPPFQIFVLPQKLDPLHFAGTATILFAVVNIAKLPPYWSLGGFASIPLEVVLMLPLAIVTTICGVKIVRHMPEGLYFGIVETLLFLVSISLILKALGY